MSYQKSDTDPDVWLVEFTNDQMAAFWNITIAYEEDTFSGPTDILDPVMMGYRTELESVQQAVSNARPIWEQSPSNHDGPAQSAGPDTLTKTMKGF